MAGAGRVLVTGGTGFIGSHLTERLVANGARVRCLVRGQRSLPPGAEPAPGDLLTGEGLKQALDGVDVVFHLAGVTKALRASDYYDGNTRATGNLLRACTASRLIHVSSLAALGPSPDCTPLPEDAPAHPLTHYGRSKLQGEDLVRRSAMAARSVILRPPVVYGPRDTDVFQLFKAASKGILIRIGPEERYFSYIYVGDLVDGVLLAASSENAAGKTYFLASSTPTCWTEFSGIVMSALGSKSRTFVLPAGAAHLAGFAAEIWSRFTRKPSIISREKVTEARQRCWVCDTSRAETELGFRARTPLQEGVASALAWYREARWL